MGEERGMLRWLDFFHSGNHCSEFLGCQCGDVFKGRGRFQSHLAWRQVNGYDALFVISVRPSYLDTVPPTSREDAHAGAGAGSPPGMALTPCCLYTSS